MFLDGSRSAKTSGFVHIIIWTIDQEGCIRVMRKALSVVVLGLFLGGASERPDRDIEPASLPGDRLEAWCASAECLDSMPSPASASSTDALSRGTKRSAGADAAGTSAAGEEETRSASDSEASPVSPTAHSPSEAEDGDADGVPTRPARADGESGAGQSATGGVADGAPVLSAQEDGDSAHGREPDRGGEPDRTEAASPTLPAAEAHADRSGRLPMVDLELGDPAAVVDSLEGRARAAITKGEGGDDLVFAYAYALQKVGRADEARVALELVRRDNEVLRPYAELLLGETFLKLNRLEEGRRSLEEAIRVFPKGERRLFAELILGRVERRAGRLESARSILESAWKESRGSRWRYAIRLELGKVHEALGAIDRAIALFEWLWSEVPQTEEAAAAGMILERYERTHRGGYGGPSASIRYRRAQRLLGTGRVDEGLASMLALEADTAARMVLPQDFEFELARAFFQAKAYTRAADAFATWSGLAKESQKARAIYWQALTAGRLGRYDEAIERYRKLAETWGGTWYARSGLYRIGLLELDRGRYSAAEKDFVDWYEKYSSDAKAESALWYIAWTRLRQRKFDAARESYALFEKRFKTSTLLPGVFYWQGRMLDMDGRSEEAASFYRRTLEADVPSHYAAFSEVRLHMLGASFPPLPPPDDDGLESLALPSDPSLERARRLMNLGLRTWAREELDHYEAALTTQNEKLALAAWDYEIGNYGAAYRQVIALGLGQGIPAPGSRGIQWMLSYPEVYPIQLAGIQHPPEIGWDLIYGVMRQESEFRPWVTSPANARGLMQVIPETAEEVCRNRGVATPPLEDMYRPRVSVQLGVWHLEDLMKEFDGRLPLVVAAYNAGPEAVQRWLTERPVDPIDAFIEEISYAETRRYVRHVLSNMWVYRRLYGDATQTLPLERGLDAAMVFGDRPLTETSGQ